MKIFKKKNSRKTMPFNEVIMDMYKDENKSGEKMTTETNQKKEQKKEVVKNIAFCAGMLGALAAGVILVANSDMCASGTIEMTSSDTNSDDLNKGSFSNGNFGGDPIVSTSTTEPTSTVSSSQLENSNSDVTEPTIKKVTADDVVQLSKTYAEYVNKTAILATENYKFAELKPEDLYAITYLANISFIDSEETDKLIEMGAIQENFHEMVGNNDKFLGLYITDTINKIYNKDTNIIDLKLLMVDEHDKSVADMMQKMITDSVTNTKDENLENYKHLVFYFGENMTYTQGEYDYSTSPFEDDIDELTTGGKFLLGFTAVTMDKIYSNAGIKNARYSNIIKENAGNASNIINTFYDECRKPVQTETEISITLSKII